MWVLLASLWYLSGVGLYLFDKYISWDEITLGDIACAICIGIFGPLYLVEFVNWNYPIYRKK